MIAYVVGGVIFAVCLVYVIIKATTATHKTKDGELLVFVSPGGKSYHITPKCSALKGRSAQAVRISKANKDGLQPCRHCIKRR